MSRRISAPLVLAVAATAVLVATTSTLTNGASAADRGGSGHNAKKVPTKFALSAAGYGTKARGGDVPARSDMTAFESLNCTNLAGLKRHNFTADSEIEGVGTAGNVRTRAWSTKTGNVVSTYGSNQIEDLKVFQDDFGKLHITRLRSLARAFHDGTGFHTSTQTTVGDITYTSTDGESQDVDPPTPGDPVEIPGVLKITVGATQERRTDTLAKAVADGLNIVIYPSNTRIRVAHAMAKMTTGVKSGLFHGFAASTETRADDPTLRSGRQPLLKMPCLGTGGQIRKRSTTQAGPDGVVDANEAHTRQRGTQTKQAAIGFEEASIESTTIGADQLVLTGIVGRVNVTRTKTALTRDIKGTTIGSATVGGESFALPELDGFAIPGLVRVDTNVVTKIKNGLDVVAVRLTFLDGSGRVTDLGHARLTISRAG